MYYPYPCMLNVNKLLLLLLNKFTIKTLNNKLQEVTLQDGSKEINYLPGTIMDYASLQS